MTKNKSVVDRIDVVGVSSNTIPGLWSSSGVTTDQTSSTDVLCTSTHLTSFSVLVSVQDAAVFSILFVPCVWSLQ